MGSGRSSLTESIRRVVFTLFFMLEMVGSLLLSSGPLFVSVSDVAVLLVSTTFGCSSCLFSVSDWKEYSFSSSVIDIPLLSLIRAFIVMCAYSLCSSPSSYKPYLALTVVCGVVSAAFLIVKATVFSLQDGPSTTVFQEAQHLHNAWALPFLFLSSMAFGFAHIIMAQRARYYASRKLLFRWEDEEAKMSPRDAKIFSPRKISKLYKLLNKYKRGDGHSPASALADADSLFMDWNGLSVHYKLIDVYGPQERERTTPASWKADVPVTGGYSAEQVSSDCHGVLRKDASDCSRNGVVLIHGFGGGVFSWRHVMTPLARQTRSTVAAFDRPGWGVTSRPSRKEWTQKRIPNPYELESQVDLLFSFCEKLQLGSVVLVGHDDGGLLALMAAAKASKSETTRVAVKGVVLVGVSLSRELVPSFARLLLQTPWGRPVLRLLLRSEIGQVTNPRAWHDSSKLTADILELYRAPLRVQGWDQALAELTKATMQSKTVMDVLQTVENLPALLVAGVQDMLVPLKAAQSLATKLPQSTFVGIPGCGHLPPEECPGALLAAMLPFISSIFNDGNSL